MFKNSNLIVQRASFLNLLFNRKALNCSAVLISRDLSVTSASLSFVKSILTLVFLMSAMFSFAQVTNTIVYDPTGSAQNFTVPLGVSSFTIEAWGAGGAGGGGNTTAVRGGGGGGAYTRFTLSSGVSAGQVYTVNVGSGGLGTSNPGGAGGASNVALGATVKVNAAGGIGGSGTNGGAGGNLSAAVPATGSGLFRTSGGNGGSGNRNGGGGGGSAGTGGNGGNGGNGAPGLFGAFGNVGAGGSAGSGTGGNPGASGGDGGGRGLLAGADAGNNGGTPGAGGGGRSSSLGTSNISGGNGGGGRIIITYQITATDLSVTKTVSNATPTAGEAVTFSIIAKNNRNMIVSDIVVTDILPSGYTFLSSNQAGYDSTTGKWNVGTLAANATASTLTITAIVKPTGIYNNTASVISTTMPDDTMGNNSQTVAVTVCKAGLIAPQVNTPVNP